MDELELQMERESARQNAEAGITNEPAAQTDNDIPGEQNAAAGAQADASASATTTATQEPNTNNQDDQVVFNQLLERFSNGSLKTADDFSSFVTRIGEFDNLSKEVETLRTTVASAPKFADEFEQKRNELKLSGATKDTLKTFEKLNDLGDLSTLDPLEARVMKMVLVDGMGEKIARLKVEKEFPLDSTYDEDLEIMQEDLRIASKNDLKALSDFKVQISTPVVSDSKLLDEAGKAALSASLKPVLESFSANFNSLTTLNLGGKEGAPAATLELTLKDTDKSFLTAEINTYMVENNLPVTQENVNEAKGVAIEKFVAANLPRITNDVWKTADAYYTKYYTEKYENIGGKPRGESNPNALKGTRSADEVQWKKEMLGGELR